MDVFGLVLAIPAVVVANICYVLLVWFGLSRLIKLRPWLLWPSRLVIALAASDVIVVASLGAVTARRLIGPAFDWLHLLVFLLGAPSLANLLVLTPKGRSFQRLIAVTVLCSAFGVFLVFFQVGVGETLYGPDGVGGPFSP
jgi:hypothetical protein